jgi:hypothetical protein
MIVIIVWNSELVDVGDDLRANSLSNGTPGQQRSIAELPLQLSGAEGLRKDIILLTEQVQTLTTSVSDIKSKLLRIHAVTDSIAALGNELASDVSQQQGALLGNVTQLETLPSPAAEKGNVSVSDGEDTDKLVDATSTPLVAMKEVTPTVPVVQTQETIIGDGPWVINLASLPHKADAERFVADAESKGVVAGLYQVTVRGKNYWRVHVHVPGFATVAEAKAKASLIKEKLGLKDTWVSKRWSFSQNAGPTCISRDGLEFMFKNSDNLVQKRDACARVVAELNILATALAREIATGTQIDWRQLAVHARVDGDEQVTLNGTGHYLRLPLPTLASRRELLKRARPWLAAKMEGRPVTFVILNAGPLLD